MLCLENREHGDVTAVVREEQLKKSQPWQQGKSREAASMLANPTLFNRNEIVGRVFLFHK
ncbi:hypothetical protein AMR41_21150 [Hapalosiphon sp. MRB220]|nr:hypothetical protein AMR41_21150 [Hapalosiphon sp. MRB220]